jgi:hypothetical protein
LEPLFMPVPRRGLERMAWRLVKARVARDGVQTQWNGTMFVMAQT